MPKSRSEEDDGISLQHLVAKFIQAQKQTLSTFKLWLYLKTLTDQGFCFQCASVGSQRQPLPQSLWCKYKTKYGKDIYKDTVWYSDFPPSLQQVSINTRSGTWSLDWWCTHVSYCGLRLYTTKAISEAHWNRNEKKKMLR